MPSVFVDHDAAEPYTGMCLARIYGRHDRPEERHANARLIAAAPELLEALQAIAKSAATIAALDSCREVEVLRGIAGVCCAAIAKATGADK